MTTKQALAWAEECGIAVESAHGDFPSLTEFITGESLTGSWWGHVKGPEIFRLSRAIRQSPDILTCRLAAGKITYVHRRLAGINSVGGRIPQAKTRCSKRNTHRQR